MIKRTKKEIRRIMERVCDSFVWRLMHVRNFFHMCAVIWKRGLFHHYDYGHMLGIMEYKLEQMQAYFGNSPILGLADRNKIYAEIGRALDALRRYRVDAYMDKYNAKLAKKYGRRIWYFEDRILSDPSIHKNCVSSLSRRERETPANCEKIRRETLAFYSRADAERSADLREFFKVLIVHAESWWD